MAPDSHPQGAFPDAAFGLTFRKYTPPPSNPFSPFASWDASLGLNATVFRRGVTAFEFATVFQTVGIDTPGSRVSIAGTGYLVRVAYVRTYSESFELSAGIAHLSSHLARDLDRRIDQARREGI